MRHTVLVESKTSVWCLEATIGSAVSQFSVNAAGILALRDAMRAAKTG